MADISVTASAVQPKVQQCFPKEVTYGESITPGQLLYQASDSLFYKSDANASGKKQTTHIAITPGGANDPGIVAGPGSYIKLGTGVVTKGDAYFMSATPGGICPRADLSGSGTAVVQACQAYDADTIYFYPLNGAGVVL